MTKSDEQLRAEKTVDLRDPLLAAFLAWLIPGLGHLYQKRTAKAALFFICIMGTFLYGLYLGSSNKVIRNGQTIGWGRVVYFSWREGDKRLPYLCQVGIGLPALPAVVQSMRMNDGKKVWLGGFMAPPWNPSGNAEDPNKNQPTSHDLHLHLHHYFELGTVFTMVAGLLNVLAVYDAWGGPVFSETAKKEDEQDSQEDEEDEKDAS